jgi:hypothetical protein
MQMVQYLYRRCTAAKWLEQIEDDEGFLGMERYVGVVLKHTDDSFVSEPRDIDERVIRFAKHLGCNVAFTMSSEMIPAILQQISPLQTELTIKGTNLRVPVCPSLDEAVSGRYEIEKEAYICILRKEKVAFLWSDSVEGILNHGTYVEDMLLGQVNKFY